LEVTVDELLDKMMNLNGEELNRMEWIYWGIDNIQSQLGRIRDWMEESIDNNIIDVTEAKKIGFALDDIEIPTPPPIYKCEKCGVVSDRPGLCPDCAHKDDLFWHEIEQAEWEYDMAKRD
jgi:rubrerythrin